MEKSMIQDLDVMRTSMGYRKTFTTSFNPGGYELRKSKISNLPSYKKSDLSLKLPFVVVFQTIEIQRLSEEIQALRVALKDSERQAFNCQSYEIQIRELTDQCHQYDVELLEYKQEIEKLNMISQKLYEELQEWKQKYQNFDPLVNQKFNAKNQECLNLENQIGKWKDRYRALERGKDKEMQDLKLAMENQRKSILDRQIGQMNLKFESQRSYLLGQIKKLEEAADLRQVELTNSKFQAEALRIENQVNLDASRKLKQSENKMNKLTEQLVRVNELLRRKQQQISRKDANEDYLKEIIKTLEREKINHQNEAVKVPQLQGAIKEWMVRYSRLENQANQNKQMLQRLPILEKDIQNYMMQLDKLQMILRTKIQQLSDSNQRVQKYKSLYQQSKKSQEKVPSLERKITQMAYQAQRLNDILKKRLIQVQQGKSRVLVLEKALRVFQQAEPEKRRIQQELKRQVRQVEKQKKQIRDLQRQVNKIPELESILTSERNTRQQYGEQIERLNKMIKDRNDENQVFRQKVSHLEHKISQLSDIQQELNNYKSQNNRMVQQIDHMNSKIKQRCQAFDHLTYTLQSLQDNLEHYKVVEQKLKQNIENNERMIEELNHVKSQLQKTQHNLLSTQSELNEAKNTIIDINNDKQMLTRNLNIKTQQLQQTHAQLNECLSQIQQLKQIERCYYVVQEELRLTQIRLSQTDELLKKERAKYDELQYKSQMLINELENIRINGYFPEEFRMMYQQVKANAKNKQREIQNLVKKQMTMEKFTQQAQGVIHNLCEMMKVRNVQWLNINKKIQDSISNVNRISSLQDENNDLRTQNLDLESQIKMLNLEILQANVKRSSQSPTNSTMTANLSSSASSLNFNSVPSKKALDIVVEDQGASRLSMLSNRKVLSNAENTISMNKVGTTNIKSRIEQVRSASKVINNLNVNTNSILNFQTAPSTGSINSNKGIGSNFISNFVSPPKLSSTTKQSADTYFSWKTSKTNSIRESQSPFLNSYR